jgi:hypothetical protein
MVGNTTATAKRHQRLVAEPGVGRVEQHEEAAGQHRRHQGNEGEAPARAAPREAVADQADHRVLDGVDDAGEDEDRAHDGERELQHLAVEMADVEDDRQGRHRQRQLQGRIGDQAAELDFFGGHGSAVPGRSCIHPWDTLSRLPAAAPVPASVVAVGYICLKCACKTSVRPVEKPAAQ